MCGGRGGADSSGLLTHPGPAGRGGRDDTPIVFFEQRVRLTGGEAALDPVPEAAQTLDVVARIEAVTSLGADGDDDRVAALPVADRVDRNGAEARDGADPVQAHRSSIENPVKTLSHERDRVTVVLPGRGPATGKGTAPPSPEESPTRGQVVPRAVRRVENQKLFRDVNERIAELSATLDEPDLPQAFFCECGRVGCRLMVEVPLGIYATVRGGDDLFVVLRGHEDPKREQTIADHGEFLIVRSLGSGTSLAAAAELRPTASS